jgi:hypothetical protein
MITEAVHPMTESSKDSIGKHPRRRSAAFHEDGKPAVKRGPALQRQIDRRDLFQSLHPGDGPAKPIAFAAESFETYSGFTPL